MALTPQQQSAARQTLGRISSTLSSIQSNLRSNPSAYNNTALGNSLSSTLKSGISSFGSYGGYNIPSVGMSNFQVQPTMDFSSLSSLMKGGVGISPYTPTDPSSFVNSIQVDEPKQITPEDARIQELQSERENYYNQLDTMGSRYKQMQDQAGITSGLQELANVNKQILQKKLDFEATNKQIAGQTIPTPIILKQQEVNRSAAAAEISAYSAYAQAIQGNIEMASNLIDKSLEIEYKPVLARIDYIKTQIQEQYDNMDRQDKKKAPFIQAQLDIYKSQVLDFTEQKRNAMNNAIYNKAPQNVFTSIQKAQTMEELASVGGSYIRDPKTVAEIANIYSQIEDRKKGEIIPVQKEQQLAVSADNINLISSLVNHRGMGGTVGVYGLSRWTPFKIDAAEKQDFIAGVEQMRSQLNLEELITAKSRGATFGALSDQELRVLANAATKIGSWVLRDKDGNVKGYKTSEKNMNKELEKIGNFAKLDFILKGGDPNIVGVISMKDGTLWSQNSDGTMTQIR